MIFDFINFSYWCMIYAYRLRFHFHSVHLPPMKWGEWVKGVELSSPPSSSPGSTLEAPPPGPFTNSSPTLGWQEGQLREAEEEQQEGVQLPPTTTPHHWPIQFIQYFMLSSVCQGWEEPIGHKIKISHSALFSGKPCGCNYLYLFSKCLAAPCN